MKIGKERQETYLRRPAKSPEHTGDDSAVDLTERFSAHYVAKIIQLHFHLTVVSVPSHPPLLANNDECSVAEPLDVFQPATVEAISKLSMTASSNVHLDNTAASRKRTRTKRYDEESWQAGRRTPNTGISSKSTLPSA